MPAVIALSSKTVSPNHHVISDQVSPVHHHESLVPLPSVRFVQRLGSVDSQAMYHHFAHLSQQKSAYLATDVQIGLDDLKIHLYLIATPLASQQIIAKQAQRYTYKIPCKMV